MGEADVRTWKVITVQMIGAVCSTSIRERVANDPRAERLRWRCAGCGEIVEDGFGYLAVAVRDLLAAAHDPSLTAAWRVRHDSCDRGESFPSFWLAVEDAREPSALMWWTESLGSRGWLGYTDWADLLERAADDLERAERAARRRAA